jgi:hypothetical protein
LRRGELHPIIWPIYLEDLERRGQKTDFEIELQIRARRSDHEPGDKNKDCYNINWFFKLSKIVLQVRH